jgi:hypothetical protein
VGVKSASAAIEHVAPRVLYQGEYPTEPLADDAHGDFSVDVVVHMTSPAATSGTLTATGAWAGGAASVPVTLPAGASNVTITLPAANNAVKLWWPAQTPGAQNLYNITVQFTEAGGSTPKVAMRRVGFRVLTLVTGNDTDPSTLAGKDGQDGFTMRFKVNGANIWSRGSNMIPMVRYRGTASASLLQPTSHPRFHFSATLCFRRRSSRAATRTPRTAASCRALRRRASTPSDCGAAAFTNCRRGTTRAMNSASSSTTTQCTRRGISASLRHATGAAHARLKGAPELTPSPPLSAPAATPMQTAEVQYQIRRLAEHPSIGIWDGCKCVQWPLRCARPSAVSTLKPPASVHRPPSSVSAMGTVFTRISS